jgi:hypothetical protein
MELLLAAGSAAAPVPVSPIAAIAIIAGLVGFCIGLVVMFLRRTRH